MSSDSEKDLRELRGQLGDEVRSFQGAVDLVDDAIARKLGVNRTDLRCIDILLQRGATTAGKLGTELGLTTGSVTAMVDRLAKMGYAARKADPGDRRKVIVEATPEIGAMAWEAMRPLVEDAEADIAHYTADDLRLILDFLRRGRAQQERHVMRVRAMPQAPSLSESAEKTITPR